MNAKERRELAECWECIKGWNTWTNLAKKKKMSYLGIRGRMVTLLRKEYKDSQDE